MRSILEDKSDELKKPYVLLGWKQVHAIANRVKQENRSLTAGCGDLKRNGKTVSNQTIIKSGKRSEVKLKLPHWGKDDPMPVTRC